MTYTGPATPTRSNGQPIEKRRADDDGMTLEVHSIFHTIQGEGPFSGHRAVFIRLAGCNLQCPLCDTEYTEGRVNLSIPEILTRVRALLPSRGLVVITGGEPFRQNLGQLLVHLVANRYFVQIETNGTLPPPSLATGLYSFSPEGRNGVYVVCSPKTGRVSPMTEKVACAYKYVLSDGEVDPSDGLPIRALRHTANPRLARPPEDFAGPIYIQPADMQNDGDNYLNRRAVVNSALKFGYIAQLQAHKYFNVE